MLREVHKLLRRFHRMNVILLLFASLLFLQVAQGSEAVTPVFVQKGKDVLLEVREANIPEEFIVIQWKFNGSDVLVSLYPGNLKVSGSYKGRVDASAGNFSVKLKNLQKADSGVYSAEVTTDVKSPTLVKYHVTVLDPASPVQLTVDSVSNSSVSCNFTVTCITQDSLHINSSFMCTNHTCIQEGGERSKVTASGQSLKVYQVNDSIICNHSNQVSWTRDTKNTHPICHLKTPVSANVVKTIATWTSVALGLVLVLCVSVSILCRRRKRENTIYEVPQDGNQAQTLTQIRTEDASSNSPTSMYSTVQFHTGPVKTPGTKTGDHPETVYAEVNKPVKSKPTSPLPPCFEKACKDING